MGSIGCPETSETNYNQRCVTSQKSEEVYIQTQQIVAALRVFTFSCFEVTPVRAGGCRYSVYTQASLTLSVTQGAT
jgi:hypothetical protein